MNGIAMKIQMSKQQKVMNAVLGLFHLLFRYCNLPAPSPSSTSLLSSDLLHRS